MRDDLFDHMDSPQGPLADLIDQDLPALPELTTLGIAIGWDDGHRSTSK
jgi:hypothetical protein